MERVKGIEPSYSAWKAAALPLSYTRAPGMTYHAMPTASTARADLMTLKDDLESLWFRPLRRPFSALNRRRFGAYIAGSINKERR